MRKKLPHEILGVSKEASPEEITAAFKKLAFELHPDQASSPDDFDYRSIKMRELLEAYDSIKKEKNFFGAHKNKTGNPSYDLCANIEEIISELGQSRVSALQRILEPKLYQLGCMTTQGSELDKELRILSKQSLRLQKNCVPPKAVLPFLLSTGAIQIIGIGGIVVTQGSNLAVDFAVAAIGTTAIQAGTTIMHVFNRGKMERNSMIASRHEQRIISYGWDSFTDYKQNKTPSNDVPETLVLVAK